MHQLFFVRLGKWGEIWVGQSSEALHYSRGTRVICRTGRGIEIGSIVSKIASEQPSPLLGRDETGWCRIVRRMTFEDDLLEQRLQRHKRAAVRDCQSELRRRGCDVALLDVEHLFDGRTLFFHFAGEISDEVQRLVEELTDVYEQRVGAREFARLLDEGCGPGCGTDAGQGCGAQGGCAVCVVAGACSKRS